METLTTAYAGGFVELDISLISNEPDTSVENEEGGHSNSSPNLSFFGGGGTTTDNSFEKSVNSSTTVWQEKRILIYMEKILERKDRTHLGIAASYDLHEVVSHGHGIAYDKGLPSSIFQLHQNDWTSKTLGKIVNEARRPGSSSNNQQDGNGVSTLCQSFLLSMHAALSNDDIFAFIGILHALVSWLYLNYDQVQSIDSADEDSDED